jgi:hypothetical protein
VKHSNLLILVLSAVLGAYTLIGMLERWGWATSSKQDWHNFQMKRIGESRYLIRRSNQADQDIVVEIQEDNTHAGVARFSLGPDSPPPAKAGSGSYSYAITTPRPAALTLGADHRRRGDRRDERRESPLRTASAAGG